MPFTIMCSAFFVFLDLFLFLFFCTRDWNQGWVTREPSPQSFIFWDRALNLRSSCLWLLNCWDYRHKPPCPIWVCFKKQNISKLKPVYINLIVLFPTPDGDKQLLTWIQGSSFSTIYFCFILSPKYVALQIIKHVNTTSQYHTVHIHLHLFS